MPDERVELGVDLLARLEFDTLSLAEVLDRIETITTDPDTQRRILERAQARGVIERDGDRVRPRSSTFLSFEAEVISREGTFTCRRCGTELSTGYFMQLPAGDHGPFGSSCIRKVTGRE